MKFRRLADPFRFRDSDAVQHHLNVMASCSRADSLERDSKNGRLRDVVRLDWEQHGNGL